MQNFSDVYFVYSTLSRISNDAFMEYCNTSKIHFIKRAILKGITKRLNKESFNQLIIAEKILNSD